MLNRWLFLATVWVFLSVGSVPRAQEASCYQCWADHQTGCFECWSGFPGGGSGCSLLGCTNCTTQGACGVDLWQSGCFVGDVRIATPEGLRRIAELRQGDTVLSRSEGGTIVKGTISETHINESWFYLEINGRLKVTESHPFFVAGEWVVAIDLAPGDVLAKIDGSTEVITSIVRRDRGVRVYNISVDGHQTFFAEDVYVHNKPPTPQR